MTRRRADRAATLVESSRPFTLVAPAPGVASGGVTAIGAAPRETWHVTLVLYPTTCRGRTWTA